MEGHKRAGDGTPSSGREKRRPGSGQDLVPHYTPQQLAELVKILSLERSSSEVNAAAEIFRTLGEPYKEVFTTFCSRSLDFHPDEAERLWVKADRNAFKSIAEAPSKLLGWASEDNKASFRDWLTGNIPRVALQKYKEGDRGLAEIAGVLLSNTLKASVKTGKRIFYLYEDLTSTWSKIADCEVKRLVSHALESVLLKVMDKHLLLDLADEISNENKDPEDVWKALTKLIDQVRSSGKMGSVLSLAQDMFVDEAFVEKLDSHSHLLGVRNGVVDLRSGELRARRPDDKISTIVPVWYDPGVEDPWIRETIKTIMADDDDMVKYLQTLLGYCITGEVSEDVFIVFTNSGSNGKDVIVGALQALLGDLFRQMDNDIIIGKGGSKSNSKSKKGIGGRIWSFSETDQSESFNSSTLKQLSGGNRLTIGMVDFAPRQKCILTTNHVPQLGTVNQAVKRRLLIIRFPVTFRTFADGEPETRFERKKDSSLRSRFLDHDQGFLRWLVEGAVAWYQKSDLYAQRPASVKSAIDEYLQSQDRMGHFIDAECEQGQGFWVLTETFLTAYNSRTAVDIISTHELSRRMEGRFLKKKIPSAGNRLAFLGLRLRSR